jgi:hypothetical protein
MIVGREFVFVHVMRTGGTWARQQLLAHAPASWELKQIEGVSNHTPHSWLEGQRRELPVVAFIRNPWDWYVSYWQAEQQYQGLRKTKNPWRGLAFEQAVTLMPSLTKHFHKLTDGAARLHVARYEQLPQALPEVLGAAGVEMSDSVRLTLQSGVRMNSSRRGPYREYYKGKAAEIVANREAELIERFRYTV